MQGKYLKAVHTNPYLGVQLDDRLNYNHQVNTAYSKANFLINFLRRNMKGCPSKTKEKTYKAIVRPVVDYCAPIWNPHTKKNVDKIEMIQRKAARFVTNNPYRRNHRDSVTAMMSELKWRPLSERRDMQSLILLYKVVHNLVEVPQNYLPPLAQRSTRSHPSTKFHIPSSNVDVHKYSFMAGSVRLWNKLPAGLSDAPTLDAFKEGLVPLFP